jgi:hypothetical protein
LFLRFFHIFLISAYFLCCYAEIIASPHFSSLGEKAFAPSGKNFPSKTLFFTTVLPKHLHTFHKIKVDDHQKDFCTDCFFDQPILNIHNNFSDECPLKTTLISPFNKAPPSCLF